MLVAKEGEDFSKEDRQTADSSAAAGEGTGGETRVCVVVREARSEL